MLKKVRSEDARMALASALLKRHFVSAVLRIPWPEIEFARHGDAAHGKPCCQLAGPDRRSVDFNVSHQAGLVVLVGSNFPGVEVGVDLVRVDERDDCARIRQMGFRAWTEMFSGVLSARELAAVRRSLTSTVGVEEEEEKKKGKQKLMAGLRLFYAYWSCREAYFKMTGEGLLAANKQLFEFVNVEAPLSIDTMSAHSNGRFGLAYDDVAIEFDGGQIDGLLVRLQACEDDYIIATALRTSGVESELLLPVPQILSIHDIIFTAKRKLNVVL